jgi:phage shock protein A
MERTAPSARKSTHGTKLEASSQKVEADSRKESIMALLERVSTLVRANLNDLVDRAEHPEKMIKQVILDMQNQLLQVKTQVAIAIADQHLLAKKQKENEDKVAEWMHKAELSVDKKKDDLARAALQRVESYRDLSEGFAQQAADQKAQVENLKTALRQLEQKLTEAQAKADLLIAQHRRARAVGKASDAKMAAGNGSSANAFDRMKRKVAHAEAHSQAKSEIAAEDVEERLAVLEKEDRIEQLLAELKTKRGA